MRKKMRQFFRVSLIVLLSLTGAVTLIYLFLALLPILMALLFQQAAQAKMHCWVKAVDQDGRGVKGYKCRVVERHAPRLLILGGGEVMRIFETGEDGAFEYTSNGAVGMVFFGLVGYSMGAESPAPDPEAHSWGPRP